MPVLIDKPVRRFFETAFGSDAVNPGLASGLSQSCQVPFGFCEIGRASALANSFSLDPFIDMPNAGPFY
jgi:hypothetical protein